MSTVETEKNENSNLWTLTRLKDCTYALDGAYVDGIFSLEHPITTSGDSDDVNLGIISYRESIIPIVDLRRFLGMESLFQEQDRFEQMLEQRKQDHIRWVQELERCIEEDDKFKLATDPHKCAFGRWYDNYKTDNVNVSFHLKKIDDPHRKLHATAIDAFSCIRDCENCKREECLQKSLKKAVDVYMPTVVRLLDEAKQVFRESYRKMVVVICKEKNYYGLLVDEVLSVEQLFNLLPNPQLGLSKKQQLVPLIGHRKDDPDLVMILNVSSFFEHCTSTLCNNTVSSL